MSDLTKLIKVLVLNDADFKKSTNKLARTITITFQGVSVDFYMHGKLISINK